MLETVKKEVEAKKKNMSNFYKNIGGNSVSNFYSNLQTNVAPPQTPGGTMITNKVNLNSDFFSSKVFNKNASKKEDQSDLTFKKIVARRQSKMNEITPEIKGASKIGLDHQNLISAAHQNMALQKTSGNTLGIPSNKAPPVPRSSLIPARQSII